MWYNKVINTGINNTIIYLKGYLTMSVQQFSVTTATAATGSSLISDTLPSRGLILKGVAAGNGISVTSNSNDVTINSGYRTVTTVTSAQVLALFATPISVVAAPGANLAVVPKRVTIRHAGGTAYAAVAAGEDLVLKYTNASGSQISSVIETTGFLDQTTAQIRVAHAPASTGATAGSFAPVANAAVVLHLLSGEITTGDFDLIVAVDYDIISTDFTV